MQELNKLFNAYLNEFKKMSTMEKREEIIDNIREIIIVFEECAKKNNIQLDYLNSKEILDLNKENVSEDDFLEAVFVYLEVAKNNMGKYLCEKK